MADDVEEMSFSSIVAANIKGIVQIQACIRGFLVRKWLQQLRKLYIDTAQETEQNLQLNIEWGCQLPCYPQFHKRRNKENKINLIQDGNTNKFSERKLENTDFSQTTQGDCVNQTLQNTVETQTSDVEIYTEPNRFINLRKQDTEVQTVSFQNKCDIKQISCDMGVDTTCTEVLDDCPPYDKSSAVQFCSEAVVSDGQALSDPTFEKLSTRTHENNMGSAAGHGGDHGEQLYSSGLRQSPLLIIPPSKLVSETPVKMSQPHTSVHEISTFTELTSVWDSFSRAPPHQEQMDSTQLQDMRKNIAMELLWVQQAINSRKHYLRLKSKIGEAES